LQEIRRGLLITASKLKLIFVSIFQKINQIDPSYIFVSSGQFFRTNDGKTSDIISVYSDQYFQTDIMLDQYFGEDRSYLQTYLDRLDRIKRGI